MGNINHSKISGKLKKKKTKHLKTIKGEQAKHIQGNQDKGDGDECFLVQNSASQKSGEYLLNSERKTKFVNLEFYTLRRYL